MEQITIERFSNKHCIKIGFSKACFTIFINYDFGLKLEALWGLYWLISELSFYVLKRKHHTAALEISKLHKGLFKFF